MRNPWASKLVDIYFDTHPHWVMDCACYAVTIRCKGSLPRSTQQKLLEIGESLQQISPASDDAETLRRRHFAILESGLDHGFGACPFADRALSEHMHTFLSAYDQNGLHFDYWVVMPNHLHLITAPIEMDSIDAFKQAWRGFKSHSARQMNHHARTSGSFWQNSWYDRWIRTPHEHAQWKYYLKKNPVKARLNDWPFIQT